MSKSSTIDSLNRGLDVLGRRVFGTVLTKQQAALVSDAEVKARTKWVLLIAAFIDLSGAVLLLGGAPLMCANAPGATPMGVDVPGAFPASNFADFADATGPPALDYSLAINLITVSNQLGGIFSNYLAGLASDKVGRKIVIQGCLLGGVVSYLLMFAAGVWSPNYWFFLAGNFVNGLFSGSRGVIQAYLQDIHDPKEFQTTVMPTMINFFLFGAMGGSIIGMVWVAICNSDESTRNTSIALFGPALVGCALSTGAAWVVQVYCPEPARKQASKADSDKPPPPPLTKTAKAVIAIICVAGSLDTFGDFGNKFARNTILTNRYKAARQPVVNYVLMSSNVVSVYIAQKILVRTIKRKGFMPGTSLWMLAGNIFSAAVQFVLMLIIGYDDDKRALGAYIVVWLLSQVFGICSTFAAFFLFPAFVPPHRKGAMNGLRNSLTNVVNCIAPFMLAFIYQTGSMATGADQPEKLDRASIVCLGVCGGISTLAFLCYLPLPRYLPKPPPKPPPAGGKPTDPNKVAPAPDDEPSKPLAYYDNVTWQEWSLLSVTQRIKIHTARTTEGMPRVQMPWGAWSDDVDLAPEILSKAPGEMAQLKEVFADSVTDDAKLDYILGMRNKMGLGESTERSDEAKAKREKLRTEMGRWIADYLDDAGYDNWEVAPYVFKAMIMNAFPPIDVLDQRRAAIRDRSELRTYHLAFMKVLDLHIKTAQTTAYTDLTDASALCKMHSS